MLKGRVRPLEVNCVDLTVGCDGLGLYRKSFRYLRQQEYQQMKPLTLIIALSLIFGLLPYSIADGVDPVVIQGVGYPPVKVRSKAQAKLMARRAAVLDAYRNALYSAAGDTNGEDDKTYFQQISGFVRSMEILQEEYLSDGGIRITGSVKPIDIAVSSESKLSQSDALRIQQHPNSGPRTVSAAEWKRIIEKMVTIDPKTVSEGEQ